MKNIFWWILVALLVAFGTGFAIVSFLSLSHFFGIAYAIKTMVRSFIIIAIVETVIVLVEKTIKKKKAIKDGE